MTYRPTIASLHSDVKRLEEKVDEQAGALIAQGELISAQTKATKELVDAWKTANGVVRFVKWVSTLVTALGVIWAAFRYGVWPSS